MAVTDTQVRSTAEEYARGGRSETDLRNWLSSNGATAAQGLIAGRAFQRILTANTSTSSGISGSGNMFGDIIKSSAGKSSITDLNVGDTADIYSLLSPSLDKTQLIKSEILKQLERESDLYTEISEKIGLQGSLLSNYTNTVLESQIVALRFGYNMRQVSDFVTKMNQESGKFNLVSKETLDRTYGTSRAFVGTLYEMGRTFAEFEKVGIGATNTLDAIDKAGRSSLSLGLNSKKTTELLRQELGRLNEYGFANGVQGLNRMVQRSIEFRMNMSEVFKIAEKVMSPEGAIELTANMQMLGGAIGDLNDPLKLMYMATNNVEGLQDAMMGAVQNLATYNEEQKRFEVTGINLRRVREMANAMGVDYKELTKGAIAAQERMLVNSDLMGKGFDLTDEQREIIANMSQMKDGQMTLVIPKDVADQIGMSTETAVSSLSQAQIEQITKMQEQLKDMSAEEIARGQFTSIKNIENDLKSIVQGQFRAITRTTLQGEKGLLNQTIKDTGIDKQIKEAADRQQAGSSAGVKMLEDMLSTSTGIISEMLVPIKTLFNDLSTQLRNVQKTDEQIELEKEKQRIKEKTKPTPVETSFRHIHEMRIVDRFGTPTIEYLRSYTEPAVMS